NAGVVAIKCIRTGGRVLDAGVVAIKCIRTGGRVPVAASVTKERLKTHRGVIVAKFEAEERRITLSGVIARIASVRCWGNPESIRGWRQRKRYHGQSDEKNTAPPNRGTDQ